MAMSLSHVIIVNIQHTGKDTLNDTLNLNHFITPLATMLQKNLMQTSHTKGQSIAWMLIFNEPTSYYAPKIL